ncbi:MAG: hypothetical protein J6A15_05940 [Clostridia bacterium]|nr:hypothetical protein [Clostridia bacterium]
MNENNSNENINKEVENKVEYVPKSKKSRKGDDGIYVQYRKPSIFSTILLVLIGILIGIVIMLLVYVIKINNDVDVNKDDVPAVEQPQEEQQPEVDEPAVEEKELDLSIESQFIKGLYSKIPHGFNITSGTYRASAKIQSDVPAPEKMTFTLQKMRSDKAYEELSSDGITQKLSEEYEISSNVVHKYSVENVENEYHSIFGADKDILKQDIHTYSGYVFDYVAEDNCYYGYFYVGSSGYPYNYVTVIDSCIANEDQTEIYVYDYYIYISPIINPTGSIYKEYEMTNKISDISVVADGTEYKYNGMTKEQLLESYKGNGAGKYKHTFKLDDNGNYYWYSCEPVQ